MQSQSHQPGRSNYLDFELEIGPGRGREYPVAVLRSPAGEARATMRFPFDELALENRLLTLQNALLRSGGRRRRVLSADEQAVQEFGQALFDALLSGEVRSRYDVSRQVAAQQDKGLCLKLRIQAPELNALPWEFLYDPRQAEYVCLSRRTPIVRYPELPQPVQPLSIPPPLRILGMVASPEDLPALDVDSEKQRVERAVQDLCRRGLVELTWLPGQTWRDLHEAMWGGPWHVFHFVGHGGFDAQADEGLVALADSTGRKEYLSATRLGRLLADHSALRLVLLNACEGARGSERDIFSSTAAILVLRGIPAVLAMQYEITDQAAVELARAFYRALAHGMAVEEAVAAARQAISLAVNNTVEWGTPVLYLRAPDGILFHVQERVQAGAVEGRGAVQTPPPAPPPAARRAAPAPGEVRSFGGVEMVYVPAGKFWMGSSDDDKQAWDDEKPRHEVVVGGFWIDRTPVTNQEYRRFVEATGHQTTAEKQGWGYAWTGDKWDQVKGADWRHPRGPRSDIKDKTDHPVVLVSWTDAQAYCHWRSEQAGVAIRLPTEAEWEKAARGTDGRRYPWGDELDWKKCNSVEGGRSDTTPVGRYSPDGDSPYGLADMAGNVWEWTGSLHKPYPYNAQDGREDPAAGGSRVVRGGSWLGSERLVRAAYRFHYGPSFAIYYLGFRCARSGSEP